MRTTLRLIFSIGTLLLISQFALAQGAATGDLRVTVKDPEGRCGDECHRDRQRCGQGTRARRQRRRRRRIQCAATGSGTYTVSVTAPGFATAEATDVNITVGQVAELPIGLTVASGKEVVEVTSQAELVETTRTSTTDTIGERKIEDLPINGRNYIQFTLTDSQVVRDNAPSLGGAAPTSGLNISGQRGRSNLVNVDGADATDNSVNGVRSTLVAGGGAGIPDHYQQLSGGIWACLGRRGQYHHEIGNERFSWRRVWIFAQPRISRR